MPFRGVRQMFMVSGRSKAMTADGTIQVEVVFGLSERQELVSVNVTADADCATAIVQSGIAENFPEHDFEKMKIAIWGRLADQSKALKDGDRVEILRSLEIDPRDARRRLAITGQFMGGAAAVED